VDTTALAGMASAHADLPPGHAHDAVGADFVADSVIAGAIRDLNFSAGVAI
jgi:hypothetical protein